MTSFQKDSLKPIVLSSTSFEKIVQILVSTYGRKMYINLVRRRDFGWNFKNSEPYYGKATVYFESPESKTAFLIQFNEHIEN